MLFLKKIKIIIEYGLYLLVFLLPIQTRWIIKVGELGEYGTISLYGTDLLLVMLIVLFMVFKLRDRNRAEMLKHPEPELKLGRNLRNRQSAIGNRQSYYWWLIAGLDLVILISIFIAQDKLIAIYRYGLFLLGIGLFWLIVSASYNRAKLIYSLLAGIFLQACLGIWQFLTQSSFACKWLGMAAHNAGDLGTSVVETISSIDGVAERWLRAYGGMDHPNVLGGLLVVGLLFVIASAVKRSEAISGSQKKITLTPKILKLNFCSFPEIAASLACLRQTSLLAMTIVFISALFFTFSRGAWIGLIVGILVMLIAMIIKKDLHGQKKLLEIIFVSGVLIFILFSQFQDLVMTRISADARLEVKSNAERMESYQDSWQIIKDNWLFGVGVGNYSLGIRNYELGIRNYELGIMNNRSTYYYQPVHNVFLLIWAEIGIIGLLFFILMPLFIIHNSLFKHNLRSNNLILSISLLAAIFTMFTIDHWWWSLHFGILFFWLVLGMLYKLSSQYYK